MNSQAWNAVKAVFADESINAQRPSVGRRVRVIESRKWLGAEGVITWHGIDKFSIAYKHCDSMTAQLRDARGRYGWRVRVQMDNGESFFISADHVCVL